MEFKGKQGKLKVKYLKGDYYVNIINDKGQSVAGISTRKEHWNEAKAYGKLFSTAPEMLEMLKRSIEEIRHLKHEYRDTGHCEKYLSECVELIEKATTL